MYIIFFFKVVNHFAGVRNCIPYLFASVHILFDQINLLSLPNASIDRRANICQPFLFLKILKEPLAEYSLPSPKSRSFPPLSLLFDSAFLGRNRLPRIPGHTPYIVHSVMPVERVKTPRQNEYISPPLAPGLGERKRKLRRLL